MRTVRKVSVVNSLDMNVNSHLQMVSFIELGRTDKGPTNVVPTEDSGSLNNVLANLPDELIASYLLRITRYSMLAKECNCYTIADEHGI